MSVKCSFTVRGCGIFPYDMLRYDQCWPVFPNDATNIAIHHPEDSEVREIQLNSASTVPTFDRWASFGWYVDRDTLEHYHG